MGSYQQHISVAVEQVLSKAGLAPEEIRERLACLEFTAEDARLLASIHERLEPRRERFSADFYDHLMRFPALNKFLGKSEKLDHLRAVQARYFSSLTCGRYDTEYVRNRLSVGLAYQANFLLALGCQRCRGYYTGRPRPGEGWAAELRQMHVRVMGNCPEGVRTGVGTDGSVGAGE